MKTQPPPTRRMAIQVGTLCFRCGQLFQGQVVSYPDIPESSRLKTVGWLYQAKKIMSILRLALVISAGAFALSDDQSQFQQLLKVQSTGGFGPICQLGVVAVGEETVHMQGQTSSKNRRLLDYF